MNNYNTLTDADLIVRLRAADEDGFTEIYNRYWETLINAAYQRLHSREDAEEVVQEVFVDIYFRRREIYPASTLEAYLKTALKFKVINAYRSQQLHYKHVDNLIAETNISQVDPHKAFEMKESRLMLLTACKKLPEKCRQVFMMFRFEELSHQEIAERAAISVSTVKKHIHKAMLFLKDEFKDSRIYLLIAYLCFLYK